MLKKLLAWLKGLFGSDAPPKTPRIPSPGAGTTSPGTGTGTVTHPIPTPTTPTTGGRPVPTAQTMTCPTCDGTKTVPQPSGDPVTCPTCKGAGTVAGERLSFFVDGDKAVFTTSEYGTTIPQEMEAGGEETIMCEIVVDGLTPEEYAALIETEDFRDSLLMPGAGLLRVDSWPYTDPLYFVEDVELVGTDVVTGKPAGWANVLQNTGAQKNVYFANNAPQGHAVKFTFDLNLAGPRGDSKTTYGLVKLYCSGHDDFGHGLPFNVDLNIV